MTELADALASPDPRVVLTALLPQPEGDERESAIAAVTRDHERAQELLVWAVRLAHQATIQLAQRTPSPHLTPAEVAEDLLSEISPLADPWPKQARSTDDS